jgi:general secretion pathway protein C
MKRALILTANVALGVLCIFLLAEIIGDILDSVLAPAGTTGSPSAAQAAASPRDRADREVILQRNLFNVSTLAPALTDEELEEQYEKTKLPLRLLGTAAAADPALSWCAIEDLESKQHLVRRLDEEVKPGGGVRVIKIERRRIVLQNGGRREELALEGDEGPQIARTASRPRPVARGNLERLAENRFSVNRDEVQNLATNPSALFSQARILPKYEGGQMVGVQVSAIKPGSLFEQAGLQNGDTVTGVNGSPVNGPDGASKVFQNLTQGGEITLDVLHADGSRSAKSFVPR